MPKKSRRQKMLADIRRRVRTERVLTAPAQESPIKADEHAFHFTSPVSKPRMETTPTDVTEIVAVKKDLGKTAILAAVAIAAELILFWFERR